MRPGVRRWGVRLLAVVLAVVAVLAGAVALAGARPLRAAGSGEVAGTDASAAFVLGGTTVRHVRYADRRELAYTFTLVNAGAVPLRVSGLAASERPATLLRVTGLAPRVAWFGPYGQRRITVRMLMTGCERLSARAGSVAAGVRLRIRVLGVVPRTVDVALPEQLRVGSAREAGCRRAGAGSRPPG